METKTCTKCNETKPVSDFGKSGKYQDGSQKYRSDCKECNKKANAEYRDINRELLNAKARAHYHDNRDKNIERMKRYRDAHPEYFRQKNYEYYHANAEACKATNRQYTKDNRESMVVKAQRYRARKQEAFIEDVTFEAIMLRDGESCAYCGAVPELVHLDHVHPLSRGGTHEADNLVIACATCNLQKGAKPLEEFIRVQREYGRLVCMNQFIQQRLSQGIEAA
ncbi:HNH endonuclease [Micrococcus luteus]|nr:HNH endonuclease [Micrococcus luteus]